MIRRDLLDHSKGTPTLNMPDVDASEPDHEADRYAALVELGGLDLAIVGLGSNGHIGMNEPGATSDLTTRVVDLAPSTIANAATYGASTSPTWGITVGISELMKAREVWLVVTGEHKREVLHRTLTEQIGPHLPATYLRDHHDCTVFADTDAAPDQPDKLR